MALDLSPAEAVVDPKEAAEHAGLAYVSDDKPGIRRHRAGKGFTYFGPGGGRISDAATLKRIKALAVPPAWTNVWICSETGRAYPGNRPRREGPQAVLG